MADGSQVVALRGPVGAPPGGIEGGDRAGQPDVVDEEIQQLAGGGAAPGGGLEHEDVVDELADGGRVLRAREPVGEATQRHGVGLLGHPLADARRHRSRRPSDDLGEVVGDEPLVAGDQGDPEPGQHGAHGRPVEELGADPAGVGDAAPGKRHLDGRDDGVDPGQHGHLGRCRSRLECRGDDRDRVAHRILGGLHRPPVGIVGGRPDDLGDPSTVVAQQPIGHLDHTGRAPVVDLERVVLGAGEQGREVDQRSRIGTVVAVDGLVVVADPEHRAAGRGEQPDEQEVRRGEVLELVDEQDATAALGDTACDRVGEQHLQGPADLVVEVDRAGPVELGQVPRVHLGEADHLAGVAVVDGGRVEEPEAGLAEGLDPGGDRVGVAQPLGGHQATEDPADLGFVDGREPAGLWGERWRAVGDRQGQRVEGADLQAG